MTFINPYLLLGALAVAIPIIIHFWHQKRGTVIEWAAMQWLVEKNQQQQRGLKFDNLWLLLVRSLLVSLLALMLAQPMLDGLGKTKAVVPVHIVQPDALLVNTYRFELEQALKRGEPVYWTNAPSELAATLALPAQTVPFTALGLQSAINRVPQKEATLHLYVVNAAELADLPTIAIPTRFQLHVVVDSARAPRPYLTAKGANVFVNSAGRLTNAAVLPSTVRFASAPAHNGPITVLLRLRDKAERQTVRAALDALTDVYKLDLAVAEQPLPDTRYDVVLTDVPPTAPSPKTLYAVSGTTQAVSAPNIVSVSTPFRLPSDLVESGQLPEWLGDRLTDHFGLAPTPKSLSQQQLNALFVSTTRVSGKPSDEASSAAVHGVLLLAFVLLAGFERWLALTKNA